VRTLTSRAYTIESSQFILFVEGINYTSNMINDAVFIEWNGMKNHPNISHHFLLVGTSKVGSGLNLKISNVSNNGVALIRTLRTIHPFTNEWMDSGQNLKDIR
jgi:hypothetical protein